MRYFTHILNLVVQDGLRVSNMSLARVRESVKYIRQSPARLQRFKLCVVEEKLDSKALLCLDVPTRWNSTYLMLSMALKFERVFERYHDEDPSFERKLLDQDVGGRPMEEDWQTLKGLVDMFEVFYNVTLAVSSTLSVPANVYIHHVSNVAAYLNDWVIDESPYPDFKEMAMKIEEKWDKYWENSDKLNHLLIFDVILDPRYKFAYAEFLLGRMFAVLQASTIAGKVKDKFYEMFKEYSDKARCIGNTVGVSGTMSGLGTSSSSGSSGAIVGSQTQSLELPPQPPVCIDRNRELFKKMQNIGQVHNRTEVDKYWVEECELETVDAINWWKLNSGRYPILSMMARDAKQFAESTFSPGGRILDDYRGSLAPSMVEALICLQDWTRVRKHEVLEDPEDVIIEDCIGADYHRYSIVVMIWIWLSRLAGCGSLELDEMKNLVLLVLYGWRSWFMELELEALDNWIRVVFCFCDFI